jgi:hypothetical protein
MSTGYALYIRRQMPRLRQAIDRTMRWFPRIDPGAQWHEKPCRWTFSSGFRYQFGHIADENDVDNYLSNEYTHLCIDECIEISERMFEEIDARVRSVDPVMSKFCRTRLCTNPSQGNKGGKNTTGHDRGWVKRMFVDPAPEGRKTITKKVVTKDGETKEIRRIFVPATLYDNPDPAFVRAYEIKLLSKPPHLRNIYLKGDWNAVEGSYYGECWSEAAHTCAPFKIPKAWPMWRSMDWGFRSPGCCHWYARRPEDGVIFGFFEITFREKGPEHVAEHMIKPFEQANNLWGGEMGSKLIGPADTQIFENRGGTPRTMAVMMAEKGVSWVPADKRSRQENARTLYEYLSDHDNWTKSPGVVFFKGCRKIIETIPRLEADSNNPEELAKCTFDHWAESVQYGLRYARQQWTGNEDDPMQNFDTDEEVSKFERANWDYCNWG